MDEPLFTAVAKPPAVMVATLVVSELQVTEPVRFWVLLSVKVPVAVNCCVSPLAIVGFAGVTAIESRVTALTVRFVVPMMAPCFA